MNAVVELSREAKAQLMDKVLLADSGTHKMKIIGVGTYCPAEDTIFLHLASTTKFRAQRNGKVPVQYGGWYYRPSILKGFTQ